MLFFLFIKKTNLNKKMLRSTFKKKENCGGRGTKFKKEKKKKILVFFHNTNE